MRCVESHAHAKREEHDSWLRVLSNLLWETITVTVLLGSRNKANNLQGKFVLTGSLYTMNISESNVYLGYIYYSENMTTHCPLHALVIH